MIDRICYLFAIALFCALAIWAADGMAMQQQIAEAFNFRDWFMNLSGADKRETALFIASPGIVAVISVMFLMSTFRNLYGWTDQQSMVASTGMAAGIGALCVFFLSDAVNAYVEYEVYSNKAIYAALFLTPLANHVTFRATVFALKSLYSVADHVPDTLAFSWLAKPVKKLSKGLYRTLTGKDFQGKRDPVVDELEYYEKTRILGDDEKPDYDPDRTPTPKK